MRKAQAKTIFSFLGNSQTLGFYTIIFLLLWDEMYDRPCRKRGRFYRDGCRFWEKSTVVGMRGILSFIILGGSHTKSEAMVGW